MVKGQSDAVRACPLSLGPRQGCGGYFAPSAESAMSPPAREARMEGRYARVRASAYDREGCKKVAPEQQGEMRREVIGHGAPDRLWLFVFRTSWRGVINAGNGGSRRVGGAMGKG